MIGRKWFIAAIAAFFLSFAFNMFHVVPAFEILQRNRNGELEMPENNARKRKAIEIVAQLPDDIEDALAVLEYAKGLVRDYLSDRPPSLEIVSGGEILAFSAATASANSR